MRAAIPSGSTTFEGAFLCQGDWGNEGLEERTLNILKNGHVMHDIGISRRSSNIIPAPDAISRWRAGPATEIMKRLGQDAELIDRVCWLIAHHHTITGVEKIDHRILLEADFLVNIFEGEFSRKQVDSIREKGFSDADRDGISCSICFMKEKSDFSCKTGLQDRKTRISRLEVASGSFAKSPATYSFKGNVTPYISKTFVFVKI